MIELFDALIALPRYSWEPLANLSEPSWRASRSLLEPLGSLLGASWEPFGSLLEPLARVLGAVSGLLGVFLGLPERSWGLLERSWELLEASWERLGTLLGVFWSHLGRFLDLKRDLGRIMEAITLNYEKP